ncbi:aminodeoxychorismate synthase component I [Sulfurospirillum deleyianum]|uniref:Chorismate binding-like protein n=1 Tax=Sulfurospirillum deleyianum (strain ATCC 51133 / DSM 6946 / 5175) TaxID=525898 RepID=D1B3I3_SULD5|nr:Chorismate binding-like protein [Sulfurospirillum deleyianum DSM 6946]
MKREFKELFNAFGKQRAPFFFVMDYAQKQGYAKALRGLDEDILYALDTPTLPPEGFTCKAFSWHKEPPCKEEYLEKFNAVIDEIKAGNTYMLNLTAPTKITLSCDLKSLFYATKARFKLYFKDQFVAFSPERFVRIENNTIHTFPMKGTMDASIPNAKALLLADEKEKAEHVMVVDLLRNDLSRVAKNVRVEQFRYVEQIHTAEGDLLQVSSHIQGELEENWHAHIGDIFFQLLPAGSISGTPKRSSVEIIERIEGYERGFYTGIFGVYDGEKLDSAVLIRFIEKCEEGYVFKSGGGITLLSDGKKEYDELCDKVYLPVF